MRPADGDSVRGRSRPNPGDTRIHQVRTSSASGTVEGRARRIVRDDAPRLRPDPDVRALAVDKAGPPDAPGTLAHSQLSATEIPVEPSPALAPTKVAEETALT